MRCNNSKFLLIAILTFIVGFGVVQIWQNVFDLLKPTRPDNLSLTTNTIETEPQKLSQGNLQMTCQEIIRWGGGYAPKRHTISGGVLNGKSCMVEPIYPQKALKNKVSGQINVEVLVDGYGKIKSAKAISGNSLLWQSAIDAAYKTQVCPTLLGGEYMNVKGILVYKFVFPN